MWISKTPLRVSFLGGGTDYPSYFNKHPGAVLGGTIDKYVYTQALRLAAIAPQRFRITYRTTESVNCVDEIRHPVIRESLREYGWAEPLNIATMSDLPGGTGLGSSSSFTVGFINLLHRMRGTELTRYELARHAIHMEQEILGENVGVQDQIHAAFGGLSRYEFSGSSFSIEPVRMSTSRRDLINRSLVLVYSGQDRSASAVLEAQEKRTKSGANQDYLREMYALTRTGVSILEAEGSDRAALIAFAELLDHGWKLKRQLSHAVSNSTIDDLYIAGKSMGAWGGKLLGAGGGGFVLFIGEQEMASALGARFGRNNVITVRLTEAGSRVREFR
ncbi:galactokinase [Aestuariivirga sp.]|uniref:GHMP family kinase ATP-binding protein n=1 Tax=Aestuariivirga sp. TaxID=2650926 RepID=UPI0039E4FB34